MDMIRLDHPLNLSGSRRGCDSVRVRSGFTRARLCPVCVARRCLCPVCVARRCLCPVCVVRRCLCPVCVVRRRKGAVKGTGSGPPPARVSNLYDPAPF